MIFRGGLSSARAGTVRAVAKSENDAMTTAVERKRFFAMAFLSVKLVL